MRVFTAIMIQDKYKSWRELLRALLRTRLKESFKIANRITSPIRVVKFHDKNKVYYSGQESQKAWNNPIYTEHLHIFPNKSFFQVIFNRVASRKQKQTSIDDKVKKRLRYAFGTLFYSVYTSPIAKYILDSTYQLGFVIAQSYMLTVVFEIKESLSLIEWVLCGLSGTNLFKDVMSCLWYEETRWKHRVQRYYTANKWLMVSSVSSLTFIFGTCIIMRWTFVLDVHIRSQK